MNYQPLKIREEFFRSGCKWPLELKIQDGRQWPYLLANYQTTKLRIMCKCIF